MCYERENKKTKRIDRTEDFMELEIPFSPLKWAKIERYSKGFKNDGYLKECQIRNSDLVMNGDPESSSHST